MEKTILNMDEDTFSLGIGPEAWLATQREIQQEIMYVIHDGQVPLEEILAKVKRRSLAIKRALYAAIDAGFIIRSGRGVKGDPRLYRLPVNGTKKERIDEAIPGPGPIGDQEKGKPALRLVGPGMEPDGTTENNLAQESSPVPRESGPRGE